MLWWADRLYGWWQVLWQRLSWQLLLALGIGVFLWRNLLMPLVGDDYSYAFIWDGAAGGNLMDDIGPRQRITSLADIVDSQWSHYFTWGGRVPALFMAQLFIWQGDGHRLLFGLVNTVVFGLLLALLFWLAAGRIEALGKCRAALFLLLWGTFFAIPSYIYTMVWLIGACVYLWTAVAECAFLLPYCLAYWQKDFWQDGRLWQVILLAVAGLFAGWSMETGSIITVLLTLYLLVVFYRRNSLRSWQLGGFAGLLAGALILLLAPGNLRRLQLMQELAPDYTMPPELLFTPIMFLYNFLGGFWPILTGELPLFIPILLYFRYGQGTQELSRYIGLFTVGSLLVLCAMLFSPDFRAHGGYHSVIFLLVASAAALRHLLPWGAAQCRKLPSFRLAAALVGWGALGLWLTASGLCLFIENSYSQQWADRARLIEERRQDDLVVVPAIELPGGLDKLMGNRSLTETILMFGADLESNPRDNRSNVYAQYHGLKGIVIDKEIDWGKYGEELEW